MNFRAIFFLVLALTISACTGSTTNLSKTIGDVGSDSRITTKINESLPSDAFAVSGGKILLKSGMYVAVTDLMEAQTKVEASGFRRFANTAVTTQNIFPADQYQISLKKPGTGECKKEQIDGFIKKATLPKLKTWELSLSPINILYSVSANTSSDSVGKLLLELGDCLIGMSPLVQLNSMAVSTDPLLSEQNNSHLNFLGISPEVRQKMKSLMVKKPLIAILDSGVNHLHPDFNPASFSIFGGFDLLSSGFPIDSHGHGTKITYPVAALPDNGLYGAGVLGELANYLPIKITDELGRTSSLLLSQAIKLAVNAKADVINISFSGSSALCHPGIGQSILEGIRKGVTFSFSAGNGTPNPLTGVRVGKFLIPASDEGPLNYEGTSYPACWGDYFMGAVTSGAVDASTGRIATLSNFGDGVEILAPGKGIITQGHSQNKEAGSGTSYSAMFTTAALALIKSALMSHDLANEPLIVESVLRNGSPTHPIPAGDTRMIQSNRTLSFSSLVNYLEDYLAMSDEERGLEPVYNSRNGKGWNVSYKVNDIASLSLFAETSQVASGSEVKFQAILHRPNGTTENVTSKTIFTSTGIPEESASNGFTFTNPGILPVSITVAGSYNEGPWSAEASTGVQILPVGGTKPTISSYELIKKNPTPTCGAPALEYRLLARLSDSSTLDVTGEATWNSNFPAELVPVSPGVFSAVDAFPKKYQVRATHSGVLTTSEISLASVALSSFDIRNVLATTLITKGETARFDGTLIRTDGGKNTLIDVPVKWFLNAVEQPPVRPTLLVPTASMTMNEFNVKAVYSTRCIHGTLETFEKTLALQIQSEISKIAISVPEPLVMPGQPLQLQVRAFSGDSNVYENVTSKASFVSSNPLLSISSTGLAIAQPLLLGTVLITAHYKGKTDTIEVTVTDKSQTGSKKGTSLTGLSIDGPSSVQFGKLGLPVYEAKVTYSDQTVRTVTNAASWTLEVSGMPSIPEIANPVRLWEQAPSGMALLLKQGCDGCKVKITARYNDGLVGATENSIDVTLHPMGLKKAVLFTQDKSLPDSKPGTSSLKVSKGHWVGIGTSITLEDDREEPVGAVYSSTNPAMGALLKGKTMGFDFDTSGLEPGIYPIRSETYWFGKGFKETFVMNTTLEITQAEIVGVEIVPINYQNPKPLTGKNWIPHGSFSQRLRSYGILSDGVKVELMSDSVDWSIAKVDGSPALNSFVMPMGNDGLVFTHEAEVGDFRVTLRHKAKGVTATWDTATYMMNLTQVPEIPTAVVLPQATKPVQSPTSDPAFCTESRKNATPFAGGNGSQEDPYKICTPGQLKNVASVPSSKDTPIYFELAHDLDFSKDPLNAPIPFPSCAIFDGKHYTIGKVTLTDSESSRPMGLFSFEYTWGCADNTKKTAIIRNITLDEFFIRGNSQVGTLAGSTGDKLWYSGVFENITVKRSSVWGKTFVGGLIGYANLIHLKDSSIRANLYADNGFVGGVFGTQGSWVVVSNTYVNAKISPSGVPGSVGQIGGIAGECSGGAPFDKLGYSIALSVNEEMLKPYLTVASYRNFVEVDIVSNSASKVGGIYGDSRCGVLETSVKGSIVAQGGLIGGISGTSRSSNAFFHYSCISSVADVAIIGGSYRGTIRASEIDAGPMSYVGGISGELYQSSIQNCKSKGQVRALSAIGFIGAVTEYGRLISVSSEGPLRASEGTVGALVGIHTTPIGWGSLTRSIPVLVQGSTRVKEGTVFGGAGNGAFPHIGNLFGVLNQNVVGVSVIP